MRIQFFHKLLIILLYSSAFIACNDLIDDESVSLSETEKNKIPFFNLSRYRTDTPQSFTITVNGEEKTFPDELNIRFGTPQYYLTSKDDLLNFSVNSILLSNCGELGCERDTINFGSAVIPLSSKKNFFVAFLNRVDDPINYSLVVQQDELTAPKSGHFKIRLFNARLDNAFKSVKVSLRNIHEELIDQRLENIPYGALTDFIEFPYGTYRFSLKDENGNDIYIDDQRTAAYTYEAGGVYTLLVPAYDETVKKAPLIWRDFKFESTPGLARVMLVNADLSAGDVSGSVGSNTALALGAGSATPYYIVTEGNVNVQFTNQQGIVLAKSSYPLCRQDNMTAFLVNNDGQREVLWVSNNFSPVSAYNLSSALVSDARYDVRAQFFNFSTDAPVINFLFDSLNVSQKENAKRVYKNVLPLQFKGSTNAFGEALPYVNFGSGLVSEFEFGNPSLVDNAPEKIKLSVVGFEQGTEITPQPIEIDHPFVNDPDQYLEGGVYSGPKGEPGVYTVVLIGSVAKNATAENRARIITIKHIF